MREVIFTIPYPKDKKKFGKYYSLNAIYSGKHWSMRKKDSEYWHTIVRMELIRQGIKSRLFDRPVKITFFWDDRLDCSNHAYAGKMIEDALKGYLLSDDSRKYVHEISHRFHNLGCIAVCVEEEKQK